MKKKWKYTLAAVLVPALLAGCALAPASAAESLGTASAGAETVLLSGATPSAKGGASKDCAASTDAAVPAEIDVSVSTRDASGEYDVSEAVTLSPGDDLTITEAGVYILSGSYQNQMIVVNAGEEDKVQLVLQNASISNKNGPAIFVRSADKVFITAAEGTVNTIADGSDYALDDEGTTLDAAVFSRADLTINGAGKLTISGNDKHAVVSKDDLVVTAKALSVKAANVGLNGKDSVTLSEASVDIMAGSDGVRSDNGEDAEKGYVALLDSELTITAANDGIQAETVFTSEGSSIAITAGGGSSAKSSNTSESYKGIKAGVSITISGGSVEINALDDAIHTNGSLVIRGGDFTLQSRDDAIHANEKAEIAGGTLQITAAEGIEASYILISGGDITIAASDDGLNAAWKSSTTTPTVEISGGTLEITMGAGDTDAIDANGNLIISGGTIRINGNSAFDYDGSASFTGGTVYVNGQQVTTLPNQMMGGGMGGWSGFGGGMGGQNGQIGTSGRGGRR